MKFGEVLKMLRTERGLTQEEFAKIIGTSRSTIGMYEQGKREPDFETQEKIADYFNVTLDYLRSGKRYTLYMVDPRTNEAIEMTEENIKAIEEYQKHKDEALKNALENDTEYDLIMAYRNGDDSTRAFFEFAIEQYRREHKQ